MEGRLDSVLILAPYRKDADYLAALLTQHDVPALTALGRRDLEAHLRGGAGILVATHEGLTPEIIAVVAEHLESQPGWSEMPVVILLDRAAPQHRIKAKLSSSWPRSRQIFYQRPVAALELLSGIQSALLARLRQREVRDQIDREVELRHELNHRVKNILASVASVFEISRRNAVSLDQFVVDFRGRLDALSNVHSQVFEAGGEAVPLADIVELTLSPYRAAGQDRVTTDGPPVIMRREPATTLALCLHELATNATKYGALSVPEGHVLFRWRLSADEDQSLSIEWSESGGPPVAEPSRKGYGTRYIRAALKNLFGTDAEIIFAPEGVRCVAAGPLSRLC